MTNKCPNMKILLLTTHLRMGGVPIYVVNLAAALKKRNHNVWVSSSGGELIKRLEADKIPHVKLNIDTKSELSPKVAAGICRLYRFVKENGIEIIHTNTRVSQVMGQAVSLLSGARHISTCHGFFKPRLGRKLFGCWGRKVVAISEAVRTHLVDDFNIEKSRIALVHNGIDLEFFNKAYSKEEKDAIRRTFGLRDGPVVGIIARLSSVKGHEYLVKAMKTAVQNVKSAQLFIVGEGREEQGLRALVKGLGIEKSVNFTRPVFDTSMALSVMDVFVMPSIKEGLGLAIIEAMAAGRPVVASDTGGIYSVIKDNVTGLLVPPGDSKRLAEAILKMLEDRELAARLALNGQRFVRQNFSLSDMADKVEAVYKQVLR